MLKLPCIFSDNMVLQREKKIYFWGQTDGSFVSLLITDALGNEVVSKSKDAENGSFVITSPPLFAGGPFNVVISDDEDSVEFQNVYIGEVWLAGGQSNMELEIEKLSEGAELIAKAGQDPADRKVRFFYTPKEAYIGEPLLAKEKESAWQLCSPENVACWSAVGYYYAKRLAEELDCMVGIIGCNWGGTSASCWQSREALEGNSLLKGYIEKYDAEVATRTEEEYLERLADYEVRQPLFDKNVGEYYKNNPDANWDEAIRLYGPNLYPGPVGDRSFGRPAGLYETMIKRVAPYSLRGFIYYQGENDTDQPDIYEELLTSLVKEWRGLWMDDELYFINTQLPIFLNEGDSEKSFDWAFIREAQMKVFQKLNNTGLAVNLEAGEYHNIHPLDKKTPGNRLALQALYRVYGKKSREEVFGPIFKEAYPEASCMLVVFENAEKGLVCTDKDSLFEDFEIAGEDGIYYPADKAEILDGGAIKVGCEKVTAPVYVRYFWKNFGSVKLFGTNSLPAAPFRTSEESFCK